MDYKALLKDIKNGDFKPLYVLHGEEPYFIDVLSDALIEHAVDESEKDFNLAIYYGRDIDALTLMSEARSFPFMGTRKVVVVREAQDLKDIYELEKLLPNLVESNILVICHKYKALDGKRKFTKELVKYGVNFKSEKVKEYNLTEWISTYVRTEGYEVTSKAAALLGEFLGNDLSRIVNELDKLAIVLEKGTKISDVHIEENIGISKDYNVFELVNAIAIRDTLKAFQIADYFEKNPKDHSIIVVIPSVFKLFTNMMRVHFAPTKTPEAIASSVGLHPFVAKELIRNSPNYPPKILARNVEILHNYDLKAKGVGNSSTSDGQLLKEMLVQILN
ncbi:DNA polymerase III subunit delta [Fluviicola taffensis]|uniref:DNA polymerase III subunit delta n=1 Tax=Fluviicola taffensis (strain DSM 16823 / NCIMB 13979 / RW262) TaxID=755732 RepID=F2IFS1_FLUTR|nr:DNA polymerase III subunit delta [Fluviicola taffensis]AEA42529.1 DNA polymerase III, delta subunit [Fluviicola taffensis DSM 16823]